jgi:hypothetical protein
MRTYVRLLALSGAFSAVACAGSWQGRLIDADCYQHAQNPSAASCDPIVATTVFAVVVANKIYTLDDAGNLKAAAALNKAETRWGDPVQHTRAPVTAKITGTIGGRVLKVETLEIQ